MRVIRARVENVMGCELAEVELAGRSLTVVGGNNHQGKTSFLDAIAMTIGGKRLFPREPIREGEDEAEITVALDGGTELLPWPCTVTRSLRRSDNKDGYTTRLEIVAEDGHIAPSPQALLNSLSPDVIDPLAFVRQAPKEQVDTMKRLLGLDFSELDHQREITYSRRTMVNREIKELDGKIKKTPVHGDLPSEPVKLTDLLEELKRAELANAAADNYERMLSSTSSRLDEIEQAIRKLTEEKRELEKRHHAMKIQGPPPRVDLDAIKERMVGAEQINARLRDREHRLELMGEKKSLDKESKALTKALEAIDETKRQQIAEANWPVEGLGFGDTVEYNGLPFGQLSSAEQLNVSVAIAMRLNPEFPFIIIRDGSLLDPDHLMQLAEIVDSHGGQCLVERVSQGRECHVIFEDGRVQ